MVYGFIAAGAWGTSTIAAAKASRFAGAYTALLLSQSLGVGHRVSCQLRHWRVPPRQMHTGHAGWLPAALVDDAASVEALLLALPFTRRPRALWHSRRALLWVAVAGLTESAALLSFACGGLAGHMAITAAVSSLYPVIPLAAGIVPFREHCTGGRSSRLGPSLAVSS